MTPGIEAILDGYGTLRNDVGRRLGCDAVTARAAETMQMVGGVADFAEYKQMGRGISHKLPGDITEEQALPAVGGTINTGLRLYLNDQFTPLVEKASGLYENIRKEICAQYSPQNRPGPVHDCHESRWLAHSEHWQIYTCTHERPADVFEQVLTTKPREVIGMVEEDLWNGFRAERIRGRASQQEQAEGLTECFRAMVACGVVYNIHSRRAMERALNDSAL